MDQITRCDVIVIGGGPAGFSAAIYAARAGLNVLVLEQGMPGGQIASTDFIDNYPGIQRMSGTELGEKLHRHAEDAGALVEFAMVESLSRSEDGMFHVKTTDAIHAAPTVIAATGSAPRTVGFKGEDTYRGRGISYCGTCDGAFFKGRLVFVIGGGVTACQEAMFLTRFAREVIMVVRRNQFRAPKSLIKKVLANKAISVRFGTSVLGVEGSSMLSRIVFQDNATMETYEETHDEGSFGVFVFVGNDPSVCLVKPYVDLGTDGGVITDEAMATRTPGLFCAGDMREKDLRQVVTAISDGAIAAVSAYRYIDCHAA
ncbi:Thioredoxin-disulfide reductase [Coriobacterium glomerans PW2]|uniref:Thioredoxin-disulfide reductase n=1 Tax=Coriobacterium glomerans (strain ATCC 49209 / DSM 20642 / JCM 10262 / PW2) TaxID=700015 RepID=F2N7W5_CORGP|nr:Thioredoxin-disulfide reductase [Coriobacterium glomerans PW2]